MKSVVILLGFCGLFGGLQAASNSLKRPHIVHIMADDLGYDDVGYNNPEVKTPIMDKLAREGRTLTDHYAMATCTPSRSALLSGVYPFKSSIQHLVISDPMPHCAPPNLPFAPEYLKELGYKSHLIGKWHLGFCQQDCTPLGKGFDTHYGMYLGEGDHFNHTHGVGFDWRDQGVTDKSVIGVYTADLITDRTVELIENHAGDESLYMFVAHTAPHTPLQAPQNFIDMYPDIEEPRKTYLAMVTAFDDSVGQIVDALKAKGVWENTFLLVSSDNGGDPGGQASNLPYRGGKGALWEGGTRTVAIASGGVIKNGGEEHHGLIHHIDWLPTFIAMAGGDPEQFGFDGTDQSGMILRGEDTERWEMIYNLDQEPSNRFGQAAIRQGDYKLIWGNPGYADGYGFSIRKFWMSETYLALIGREDEAVPFRPNLGECTRCDTDRQLESRELIIDALNFDADDIESGVAQLYNLRTDHTETNDLSKLPRYSDIVTRMKSRILEHLKEYVPPQPLSHAYWVPQSLPQKFPDEAWETGWCESLDLDLAEMPEPGKPSLQPPTGAPCVNQGGNGGNGNNGGGMGASSAPAGVPALVVLLVSALLALLRVN